MSSLRQDLEAEDATKQATAMLQVLQHLITAVCCSECCVSLHSRGFSSAQRHLVTGSELPGWGQGGREPCHCRLPDCAGTAC